MNELKRYDQELARQLTQLPLPDENTAWAEMEKMLERDDDDPVVIPFYRRFGCLLMGLLGLLLLSVGGWFYYQKDKKENVTKGSEVPVHHKNMTGKNHGDTTHTTQNTATLKDSAFMLIGNNKSGNSENASAKPPEEEEAFGDSNRITFSSAAKTTMKIKVAELVGDNDEVVTKGNRNRRTIKGKLKASVIPAISTDEETADFSVDVKTKNPPYKEEQQMTATVQPTYADSTDDKETDSSLFVKKDIADNKKKIATTPAKEVEPKNTTWMLAAGLTLYQPLPLNGESAVPYNSYGRKGSLTDYIPEVHFRLYRNKKWFLHTAFRYGAPQTVKPFSYKQDVIVDSFQTITRSVFQLRKTYYHQVPLSFNYYVLPGLSVGTGIIYNRFSGAVANRDVFRGNNTPVGDTLLSSGIVSDPDKNRFVKSHFQWSVETQYQWKRFFIGARYSKDINPYIKFTDIVTGASVEKKAAALNIFIRYELWRKKL